MRVKDSAGVSPACGAFPGAGSLNWCLLTFMSAHEASAQLSQSSRILKPVALG